MSLGLNFAKKLKEIRKRQGRTQEWLAHKVNLARATINRWETKGAGSATLDEIELIASALELSVSELVGLSQSPGNFDVTEVARAAAKEAVAAALRAQDAPTVLSAAKPSDYLSHLPSEVIELLRKLQNPSAIKTLQGDLETLVRISESPKRAPKKPEENSG